MAKHPIDCLAVSYGKVLSYGLLGVIAALVIAPIAWLLSTAFKAPTENILAFPPLLLPMRPTLENFVRVWVEFPFGRYLWNSTIVAGVTVILNLLFCSLAAYPLARYAFRGKSFFFWSMVGTSMIPFQITMIPLYQLAVQFHLKNTYLGLILPYAVSAFGIFLLRQAFAGVPKELEEAAVMDGCFPLEIWWCVMIPAVRPALVTLSVFTFVAMWGDFLWPLVMIDRPHLYTLPLGLASLSSGFGQDWRLQAAGSILSILPVLIFFLLVQRYVIPSNASSGIKGGGIEL